MKRFYPLFLLILVFISCKKHEKVAEVVQKPVVEEEPVLQKFGYTLNDFNVVEDTIRSGESFGQILDRNHVEAYEIFKIAEASKDSFDVRKLRAGKPYTILASKDTTQKAQVFIYRPNKVEYVIIDFKDSVSTSYCKKNVKAVTKTASGMINSSLSEAMDSQGLNYSIVNDMSDIYAWTIDFFHLQKGDNFKLIYDELYVDDTVSVGIGDIKAAYFEHKGNPFYAFNYVSDTTKNIADYYDEKADNLRRQFLKAPLKFSRITSRYNLRRYIKLYGRVKPHKGTDFAAAIGTPILATASGTVIDSRRRGGNGNYVKIRHNSTYSTQYLHMKKRLVKKGDFVKQGDVIGTVGMTGYTSGPHVCYRFWKNGKQVDPFKQKLPTAEALNDSLKVGYLEFIKPIKQQLDNIEIEEPAAIADVSETDL